jgi:hypothetical protein
VKDVPAVHAQNDAHGINVVFGSRKQNLGGSANDRLLRSVGSDQPSVLGPRRKPSWTNTATAALTTSLGIPWLATDVKSQQVSACVNSLRMSRRMLLNVRGFIVQT